MSNSKRRRDTSGERQLPNILITGTPGTGKTTLLQAIAKKLTKLRAIDIGAMIRDNKLHTGWDEEYETYVLDEDKVCFLPSDWRLFFRSLLKR